MGSEILKLLILITLFIVPVTPALFGFGYENIKVLVFICLTIISGLVFGYLIPARKTEIKWSRVRIAALVFLTALSISSLIGIHPLESLMGKYPYYQGLVLYWLLFLFGLCVAAADLRKTQVIKIISLSSLVVSLTAIAEFIGIHLLGMNLPTYAGRVISTFGQPNLYSGFLLMTLPFIVHNLFVNKKVKSYLRVVVLIVAVIAILLSFSKTAIGIMIVLVVAYIIKNFTSHRLLFVYLSLVVLINVLIFAWESSSGVFWDEIIRPLEAGKKDAGTAERRVHILPVMFELFSNNPLIGSGVDSIDKLYIKRASNFSPETVAYSPVDFNLKNILVDRSHNYFIDILIFSGILGLLLYLYLIYQLFKSKSPGYFKVFLILYLIWTSFQVQSVVHLMLFWFIVGLIDNKKYLSDDES